MTHYWNQRGAKTAMALALRSPSMIKDIVSVDNAPIDAILSTDFAKYVRGMKKVEEANVTSQKEADQIFSEFEEVRPSFYSFIYIYIYIYWQRNADNSPGNHPVPPHPTIPPGQPLHARRVQDQEIPRAPRHPGQGPRAHGRFPLQGPQQRPLRETGAVCAWHAEQVRAGRGAPPRGPVFSAVRGCGYRGWSLGHFGEPRSFSTG